MANPVPVSTCPNCLQQTRYQPEKVGQRITCSQCGQVFVCTAPPGVTPPPPLPAPSPEPASPSQVPSAAGSVPTPVPVSGKRSLLRTGIILAVTGFLGQLLPLFDLQLSLLAFAGDATQILAVLLYCAGVIVIGIELFRRYGDALARRLGKPLAMFVFSGATVSALGAIGGIAQVRSEYAAGQPRPGFTFPTGPSLSKQIADVVQESRKAYDAAKANGTVAILRITGPDVGTYARGIRERVIARLKAKGSMGWLISSSGNTVLVQAYPTRDPEAIANLLAIGRIASVDRAENAVNIEFDPGMFDKGASKQP